MLLMAQSKAPIQGQERLKHLCCGMASCHGPQATGAVKLDGCSGRETTDAGF